MSASESQLAFLRRIKTGLGQTGQMDNVAQWLCENTSLGGELWGFKHHEYQIDIANDKTRRLSVKKCSQVGLSELLVRKILAYLNTTQNTNAIYTLPSTTFSKKFVKGRFDPVIAGSRIMLENLNGAVNSTELKQFISNFLYIVGTYGSQSAISVPADMVIQDETDFCDQKVLTMFASRLRHADQGGYLWKFSTPTVDGFGISESYSLSDQKIYLCKCRCGHEGAPVFEDYRIPGYDKILKDFRKEDLQNPEYFFDQAEQCCPRCGNPWPLHDPDRRRWVAQNSLVRGHSGYHVRPWDVPKFNSPSVVFGQAETYETHMDWMNFVLGEEFSDASNSFVKESVDNSISISPVMPGMRDQTVVASGCVMGVDVGKTSWIVIGKPQNSYGKNLDIIYLERVTENKGTDISDRVIQLMKMYGVRRSVIDAAPDFSTAIRVCEEFPEGWAFGCYYVSVDPKKMSDINVKDPRVIHVNRTKSLNDCAARMDSGSYRLPKCSEVKLLQAHLSNLKRVDQAAKSLGGEKKSFWIKTGPDHYGHALNYCTVAASTLASGVGIVQESVLPSITKTRYTTEEDRNNEEFFGKKHRRTLMSEDYFSNTSRR